MSKLNHLGVIVSVILVQILGFFWYGPHLFGDTSVDIGSMGTMTMVLTLLNGLVLFYFLDWLLKLTGTKDITGVLKIAVIFGLLVLGLTLGMHNIALGKGVHSLLIDGGYQLMSMLLAGSILLKLKKI